MYEISFGYLCVFTYSPPAFFDSLLDSDILFVIFGLLFPFSIQLFKLYQILHSKKEKIPDGTIYGPGISSGAAFRLY